MVPRNLAIAHRHQSQNRNLRSKCLWYLPPQFLDRHACTHQHHSNEECYFLQHYKHQKPMNPLRLANSIAANESAVSPDCETAMIKSSGYKTGFLYLNSDAYSTSTGTRAKSSNKYSQQPSQHASSYHSQSKLDV
jgi:hypothetical protein